MTRRWLVVCGGLVVGTSLATSALADEATRPPTLAERFAAIKQSWQQSQPAPANRSQVVQASHTAAQPGPAEPAGLPQIDARSLLPTKLFSRRGHEQASAEPEQSTRSRQTQRPNDVGPREGSARAASNYRQDFTLPGLGGARPSAEIANRPTSRPSYASDVPSSRTAPAADIEPSAASSRRRRQSDATPQASDHSSRRPSSAPTEPENYDAQEFERELAGLESPEPNEPEQTLSATEISDQPDISESQTASDATDSGHAPSETAEQPQDMSLVRESTPSSPIDASADRHQPEPVWDRERPVATNSLRSSGPKPFVPSTRATVARPVAVSNRRSQSFGGGFASVGDQHELLVANPTPVITSDIRGPKQILVGREATYELRLQNQGSLGADNVVASVHVPSWADVVTTTATRGVVSQTASGDSPGSLEWHLEQLDAGATETLEVRLIPRTSRPLELGISWTCAPVGSRAVVEVQEPKLEMRLSGPDEVLFGKPQLYRLTLSNPGTGEADNVKIDLLPPGGGEGAVTSHRLGALGPGASKSLEVELTAREAGKLQVKASATAEGGLTSDVTKEIFCRKPELDVDWRGPEMTYADTEATYYFRVRNPGTATANDVLMTVSLPQGIELLSASEGQSFDPDRGEISWQVGSLNPGDDFYTEMKCIVHKPGENQLQVAACTATGDLADCKQAATNVVALADLKLEVTDPTRPVPVGEEAVYEIHVLNRGSNTAEDVNVVALFSEGMEPFAVEGAQYSMSDGRVSFHTIDALPAGRQITLRIRARATEAGTHVFRAEVLCRDLEIKLAAEETTRFFDNASLSERSAAYRTAEADGSMSTLH